MLVGAIDAVKDAKMASVLANVNFVGGRRRLHSSSSPSSSSSNLSYSSLLLIVLVVLANFCAVLFMLNNVFVMTNPGEMDHIIESCQSRSHRHQIGVQRVMVVNDHYLCHFIDIWKQYQFWSWWDTRWVAQTSLLLTLLLAAHFVAASGLMLFGGIVGRKYSAFLPFIVVTMVSMGLLLFLLLSEMAMNVSRPMMMTTSILVALILLVLVTLIVFMMAVVVCIRTREINNNDIDTKRPNMGYIRF